MIKKVRVIIYRDKSLPRLLARRAGTSIIVRKNKILFPFPELFFATRF